MIRAKGVRQRAYEDGCLQKVTLWHRFGFNAKAIASLVASFAHPS